MADQIDWATLNGRLLGYERVLAVLIASLSKDDFDYFKAIVFSDASRPQAETVDQEVRFSEIQHTAQRIFSSAEVLRQRLGTP